MEKQLHSWNSNPETNLTDRNSGTFEITGYLNVFNYQISIVRTVFKVFINVT